MRQYRDMANTNTILEVRNLSNHYEGQPLLQDVNFSLDQGEILCLLGPSGSGKTTLLRLIAGLEQEESGEIFFKGNNVRRIPPHKRQFGMMFQEYALFPHKDVWHNVSFGLEMQQCPVAEKKGRINTILRMVGLSGFEHRKIDDLSGGERQRVALARSLAPEPQLLLLDEPLGSLDRTLRDHLTIEIRNILKSLNMTAIFVTHDQEEAFSISDKIAVLHDGKMQQLDTPEALYLKPSNETVARFLGFSNFIQGEIAADGSFSAESTIFILPESIITRSNPATLLIRPEGSCIVEPGQYSSEQNSLEGIVSLRQFVGGRYKVEIRIDKIYLTFYLPTYPPPPAVGEPIKLLIPHSSLVLIAT